MSEGGAQAAAIEPRAWSWMVLLAPSSVNLRFARPGAGHRVVGVQRLPRLILLGFVGEVDAAAQPDQVKRIAVIQRKLARFPGVDHTAHRAVGGIEQRGFAGDRDGFGGGADFQRQVQLQARVDVQFDLVAHRPLEPGLLGGDPVHPGMRNGK